MMFQDQQIYVTMYTQLHIFATNFLEYSDTARRDGRLVFSVFCSNFSMVERFFPFLRSCRGQKLMVPKEVEKQLSNLYLDITSFGDIHICNIRQKSRPLVLESEKWHCVMNRTLSHSALAIVFLTSNSLHSPYPQRLKKLLPM